MQNYKHNLGAFLLREEIIKDESGKPITTTQSYKQVGPQIETEIFNHFYWKCKYVDRGVGWVKNFT